MGDRQQAVQTADRDARGRFVTGNPGGPGNPHARRTQELRSALSDGPGAAAGGAVCGHA